LPDRVNIGVIGTGRMGAFHLGAYSRVEGARVVAVADPDPAARQRALSGRPVREYGDWRELLDKEANELDAVSIASPSALHAEMALAALEVGLHLLVEKPIATTLPDALRMRGAARNARRTLMVGHVERFNPAVTMLRERLADGAIGAVHRLHATRVGPLPGRICDAGVAIDLATHDLDVIQHLLGRQVTEIYADGGRFAHETQEDMITCLARFEAEGESEVRGLLDVNWLTPEPRRDLAAIGELGMLRACYMKQEVLEIEHGGRAIRHPLARAEPLAEELRAFIACVTEGTEPPVSAHDGVRALAAALAVRESAATRRPVRLLDMPAPVALEAVA
jgi:UDP-N-acetylglucosamine 3-dehydrogenase